MAAEIERRFLIANDGWRAGVTGVQHLHDGLITRFGGGKLRVRKAQDRAWITIKGARVGISRSEFEYEIPLADADEMLSTLCVGPVVQKTRHCVPYEGLTWSIDVHEGPLAGVVFAEVELLSADQAVPMPPWIGREITHDPAYKKQALFNRVAKSAGKGEPDGAPGG
jgi:CYTH domain-containing protein